MKVEASATAKRICADLGIDAISGPLTVDAIILIRKVVSIGAGYLPIDDGDHLATLNALREVADNAGWELIERGGHGVMLIDLQRIKV